ncbi:MAG: methyltransferase domain-containing protein [Methylomarinum sp.]|nr:methyltransferase domain-containing protein [Methylomarinum sp.]
MKIENGVQKNHYFEYRKVSESFYKNATIPIWIKNELSNKESKILDYGCGFGQNLTALANENYQNIYGVDIEKNAIKQCLKNNLVVKKLDLNNLVNPFDFKFDVIILTHIIEHIPKDEIISTLILIKQKFLSSDGKLLIAVPNAQSNTDCYWAYEDWTHTTLFTSGSLYYVLKAAGFQNVDFLDIDCTLGSVGIKIIIRRFFLKLYKINKNFWNKITASSYHKPSPVIFSYEIKCKAF